MIVRSSISAVHFQYEVDIRIDAAWLKQEDDCWACRWDSEKWHEMNTPTDTTLSRIACHQIFWECSDFRRLGRGTSTGNGYVLHNFGRVCLLPNALGWAAMSSCPVGGKFLGFSVSFNHVVSAILIDTFCVPTGPTVYASMLGKSHWRLRCLRGNSKLSCGMSYTFRS